ncbi:NADH dehydrogenase (ubiquinone) 1 alpha/beta subcomplex 1 [Schistosoma bovis]|uniref:Acyl carrier protein n=1 Tax=Schistosoma bovis TaxID=6184 RepID=A0A430QPE5_SCHBO|nr:NADH dehydrogenase (ubiquinone) 1 alpha/beta subcomplex 1 [Schistosoma bovis]
MNISFMSAVLCGFRRACLIANYSTISKTFVASTKCLVTPFKTFSLPIPCRFYGHGVPLTKTMIEDRVMLVLRLYDKIDPYKITLNSRFNEDFGIDSLDHVELVMAIEEEFEIPDMDSQRFFSPQDIIQYLCDRHDIYD